MSSNVERVPKAGAQAGAEEAVVDFLLEQIGKRAPSPTQAVKVCQTLGLSSREEIKKVREVAKNKKGESQVYSLNASKAENKKPEEKEMEVRYGYRHWQNIRRKKIERLDKKMKEIIAKIIEEYKEKGLKLYFYPYSLTNSLTRTDCPVDILFNINDALIMGINNYTVIKGQTRIESKNPASTTETEVNIVNHSIDVCKKGYLSMAKRIGRILEKRTKAPVFVNIEY